MAYSYDIAEDVERYLINNEWEYDFDPEAGRFEFTVELRCKLPYAALCVAIFDDCFLCYAAFGLIVGEEGRGTAAEFIARANYGLQNGNLELDMEDGMVQYKTFVPCKGGAPGVDVIRDAITIPVIMLDMYGDALTAAVLGTMAPKDAVEAAESGAGVDLEDLDAMIDRYARSAEEGGADGNEELWRN